MSRIPIRPGVAEWFERGATLIEIGTRFGVCVTTVGKWQAEAPYDRAQRRAAVTERQRDRNGNLWTAWYRTTAPEGERDAAALRRIDELAEWRIARDVEGLAISGGSAFTPGAVKAVTP